MPAFVTFGRILFAVLFIYSGATKLFGIQATAVIFAARTMGIDAQLYDGSFQDWSKRGLPVEMPAAAGK